MGRYTRHLFALGCVLCVGLCLALGCSDSEQTTDQGPQPDQGQSDQRADKGPAADLPVTDNSVLPWPDSAPKPDLKGVSCTPGDAKMCDEDKTLHCVDGKCENCPANYVDCDRQGDCECFGACDGDRCVTGKG